MPRLRSVSQPGLLIWMLEPTKAHPGPAHRPHAAWPPSGTGDCSAAAALCLASLHLLSLGVQAAPLERHPAPTPSCAATEA